MSILEVFCSVDDFWQQFAPNWHTMLMASRQQSRLRPTQLHPSEIMTIVILFHQSHYRRSRHITLSMSSITCTAAQRVPYVGELPAVRRVDTHRAGSIGGLSAHPTRPL